MIEVSHLTKRYGNHTAVSDLSFTVEKGQIYGFLGPNGAGKSTTMNMMTGCLAATSGEIRIDGHDIFEEPAAAKRLIGYLPELPPLYLDRTPREYLSFVAEAKGLKGAAVREQVAHVMEVTQLTEMADRLCRNLSKGYRQRVGIAQALLGDPEIIILDEPTVGLDPRQIIEIRDLITRLGQDHTVILSSHILSEVRAVCTTILIIAKGRLVACDTPENLETHFANASAVELIAAASEEEVRNLLSGLDCLSSVELVQEGTERCRARLGIGSGMADEVCRTLFWAFSTAGKPLLELHANRASLEDVFIELTRDAGQADEPEQAEKSEESEATEE